MRIFKLSLLLPLFFSFVLPTKAQHIQRMTVVKKEPESQSIDGLYTTLSRLNENNPLQSPRYDHSADVLGGRILDNHNRVVGDILDAIYDDNGALEYLYIDFDRRNLGKAYLNYKKRRLRPVSNGYIMNIDENQIEDIFSSFPTNLREEGIKNPDHVLRLSRLKNAQTYSQKGKRLGKISKILLSKSGIEVQAVFVELNYKTHQFSGLALPFALFRAEYNGKLVKLILPEESFDKILKFVANEE